MMLKQDFFCLNVIEMRHLENRSLEKYLISYQFVNLELFCLEQRNFDRTNTRLLNTSISQIIFPTKISKFKIAQFFILAHAWNNAQVLTQRVLLHLNNWADMRCC